MADTVTQERMMSTALAVMDDGRLERRPLNDALKAVNVEGYKWDIFVKWPDGFIGRPITMVIPSRKAGSKEHAEAFGKGR